MNIPITNMEERFPLVSVIVPVYNMQEFLAETLDSIVESSYTKLEILIIDDGSQDQSVQIAQSYAQRDARIRLLTQANGGACKARNHGIREAKGTYILPLDSDDLILPWFIEEAVKVLEKERDVKAVFSQGEFFGEKTGQWNVPDFNIHLLARKNMLCISALYRKEDWERIGGYCEEMQAREDWEFWMHMLKDGGRVVRFPQVGLKYRIRKGSKRISDRQWKKAVVDTLNRRHPEFMERELGGPLHYHRSASRFLNKLYRLFHPRKVVVSADFANTTYFVRALNALFDYDGGTILHDKRNQLRLFRFYNHEVIVKSYAIPNPLNRLVYGFLRKSKAQRSYEYAQMLRSHEIGSPEPVAWYTERQGIFFSRSYYVCLKSELPYTYNDLMSDTLPQEAQERYLTAIAQTVARMHELGYLHRDLSRGNILFGKGDDGRVHVEIIDLNRIRFRQVTPQMGCANLSERLPATPWQRMVLGSAYATARNLDADWCVQQMQTSSSQ